MPKKDRIAINDLPDDAARRISDDEALKITGGRAGGDSQKYMEFKMKEVLITSVSPGGSSDR